MRRNNHTPYANRSCLVALSIRYCVSASLSLISRKNDSLHLPFRRVTGRKRLEHYYNYKEQNLFLTTAVMFSANLFRFLARRFLRFPFYGAASSTFNTAIQRHIAYGSMIVWVPMCAARRFFTFNSTFYFHLPPLSGSMRKKLNITYHARPMVLPTIHIHSQLQNFWAACVVRCAQPLKSYQRGR